MAFLIHIQKIVPGEKPFLWSDGICPVKQGYGKVDRRGIQAAQRVFEAKFLFTENLAAATLKQMEKDFLI